MSDFDTDTEIHETDAEREERRERFLEGLAEDRYGYWD